MMVAVETAGPATAQDRVVWVLAAMLLLVPALGVPSELLLQDTLKSALVAFGTLGAALLLCHQRLRAPQPLRWHPLLGLALGLLLWALGSMAWSHTYLAGVEAVRWFLFALLLWLGLECLTPAQLPLLATGIHWGAVLAALWAALQFWADLRWFPQAAVPGSTFANRNFLSEYLVCALPFSVGLAAQARSTAQVLLRVGTLTLMLLALLMTATRSALLAGLVLLPVLALIVYRYRDHWGWPAWSVAQKTLALVTLLGLLLGLGFVPTTNPTLQQEGFAWAPLTRARDRLQQFGAQAEYVTGSSGTRLSMWQSNGRLVLDHPWAGVGAGAWEVQIPRYQAEGMSIEQDYYAHNEPLQLVAEYGLPGWLFIVGLACYLLRAMVRTWRLPVGGMATPAPYRALALSSLLALFVVSLAGFPWHLAGTTALFALNLGLLAASDRDQAIGPGGPGLLRVQAWQAPAWFWRLGLGLLSLALLLAAWISAQAWACESRLVRASQLAYHITLSGRPDDPAWNERKAELLRLAHEGIAIHPHYRKITSMIADELARWGDSRHARWLWESIDASRPYIVVVLTNLGRSHALDGEMETARRYWVRASALQPRAVPVRSLELLLLLRAGQTGPALELARACLDIGTYDYDMLTQIHRLALRQQAWPLAAQALTQRIRLAPRSAVESWLQLAQLYTRPDFRDDAQALQAYRAALQALPEEQRESLRRQIPLPYRRQL